jgi:hypothetical protein
MLNRTIIALAAGFLIGAATGAFAAKDDSPADTRSGPCFFADSYGVPPVPLQVYQSDRPSHQHTRTHDLHDR